MCIPQSQENVMKDEISAAVLFLTRLIRKSEKLKEEQVETYRLCLYTLLTERFKDHWFPQNPCRGQAYRCIRVNLTERRDPILEEAAKKCGLDYEDLKLPVEMTIWVDPHEVCCRFGEHKGSYCTVASFKNGNKENIVDEVSVDSNIKEKTTVVIKKASYDVQKKRKNAKSSNSPRKNGYNKNFSGSPQGILQPLPNIPPTQNFRAPIFPMAQSYQRMASSVQNFNFNNHPSQSMRSNIFVHRSGPQSNGSLNHSALKLGRNFLGHLPFAANSPFTSSARYANISGKNDKYHWNKRALSKV